MSTWDQIFAKAESATPADRRQALTEAGTELELSLKLLGYWKLPSMPKADGTQERASLRNVVTLLCHSLPYKGDARQQLLDAIDLRNKSVHEKLDCSTAQAAVGTRAMQAFLLSIGKTLLARAQASEDGADEPLSRDLCLHETLKDCFRRFGLHLHDERQFIRSIHSLHTAARLQLAQEMAKHIDDGGPVGTQAKWVRDRLIAPGQALGLVRDLLERAHALRKGEIVLAGPSVEDAIRESNEEAIGILGQFVRFDAYPHGYQASDITPHLEAARAYIRAYKNAIRALRVAFTSRGIGYFSPTSNITWRFRGDAIGTVLEALERISLEDDSPTSAPR